MNTTGLALLDQDHAEAGQRRAALHAAVSRLQREPDQGAMDATAEALAYFETKFVEHMGREDRGILPVLEAAVGGWCLLPGWMRREHTEIRSKIRDVRAALSKAGPRDPDRVRDLAGEVARLDALLTIHFHREDQWLYPIAKLVLRPEQWTAINQAVA
jgi:hemerythrin-like domain-containing protein